MLLGLALLLPALLGPAPSAVLRVREPDGRWAPWWREDEGRTRWTADEAPLLARTAWRPAAPGVMSARLAVSPAGSAAAVDLVVVRISPERVRLSLAWGVDAATGRPAWELDRTPPDALLSLNAGMFLESLPWGWVRLDGVDRLSPGRGPLSSALAVTRDGDILWHDGDALDPFRRRTDLVHAFQSFPTLLTGDGEIPPAVRAGQSIDRRHRDIRLALGLDRGGRLLVVLTRSRIPLPGGARAPLGLTVPEMAQVMGALGARQAMLLDGGLSAQLLLRTHGGGAAAEGTDSAGAAAPAEERWPGLRRVPLALVVRPRE